MSGFASKLSAAGSKGWTGFQSLWGESKTSVSTSETKPGEKTSLLGMSLVSRTSKGHRLLSEEDDWPDTPVAERSKPETDSSTVTDKTQKQQTNVLIAKDWTTGNEDDMETWLNEDSAQKGILDKEKSPSKKSSKESKKPSPRFKHKFSSSSKGSEWKLIERDRGFSSLGKQKGPLFGKLLDLDCESEEGESLSGTRSSGCDNKVWADNDYDDDDDDDCDQEGAQWQVFHFGSGSKGK